MSSDTDKRIVVCDPCDGSGEVERGRDPDHTTVEQCCACDGAGETEVETELAYAVRDDGLIGPPGAHPAECEYAEPVTVDTEAECPRCHEMLVFVMTGPGGQGYTACRNCNR